MKFRNLFVPLFALALAGCAAYDSQGTMDTGSMDEPPPEIGSLLYAHDVLGARDAFAQLTQSDGATPTDFAGLAVTEALALPVSAEFNAILIDHLGAVRPLTEDVLYGGDGLLYLVSLGVPWADGGDLKGIETLLADRLPWPRQRLASPQAFVDGLSLPVDLLFDSLVDLADGPLQRMRNAAQRATAASEPFQFLLPGAVFHDDSLELTVGPSDLAVLDAAGAAVQGAIYFFGAYSNAWTIERAFGDAVWASVVDDPTHELHVAGATAADYQIAHLNEHLLRTIDTPARLGHARDAFAGGFGALATALDLSSATGTTSTLQWDALDPDLAADLAEVLRAFAASLDAATPIPFFQPTLTVDLSLIFTEGRTIPADTDLIVVDTYTDAFGTQTETVINEDAVTAATEGLFEPPLDSETGSEFILGEDVSTAFDEVTGAYATEVDRAYSRSF